MYVNTEKFIDAVASVMPLMTRNQIIHFIASQIGGTAKGKYIEKFESGKFVFLLDKTAEAMQDMIAGIDVDKDTIFCRTLRPDDLMVMEVNGTMTTRTYAEWKQQRTTNPNGTKRPMRARDDREVEILAEMATLLNGAGLKIDNLARLMMKQNEKLDVLIAILQGERKESERG